MATPTKLLNKATTWYIYIIYPSFLFLFLPYHVWRLTIIPIKIITKWKMHQRIFSGIFWFIFCYIFGCGLVIFNLSECVMFALNTVNRGNSINFFRPLIVLSNGTVSLFWVNNPRVQQKINFFILKFLISPYWDSFFDCDNFYFIWFLTFGNLLLCED